MDDIWKERMRKVRRDHHRPAEGGCKMAGKRRKAERGDGGGGGGSREQRAVAAAAVVVGSD